MQSLDKKLLDEADSRTVAVRIDEFFEEDHRSRYGVHIPRTPDVSATAIYESKSIQALTEHNRKRAILLYYRARFQQALCFQYAGTENHLIHASNQDEDKWLNPHVQIMAASTRQAGIISAKISFECLMEFVYFVENNELIPSARSKLGKFRKWLCSEGNRFGWLVFYLLVVNRFDKNHRTPEIHGTSYIAIDALLCKEWPRQDAELDVVNLNLNIWRSILATLSEEESGLSCFYGPNDEALFKDFFNWREIDLNQLWERYA